MLMMGHIIDHVYFVGPVRPIFSLSLFVLGQIIGVRNIVVRVECSDLIL